DRHAVEVEQPQDDLLAVERRHRRHAKIERASLSHQTDAAVVGQAILGEVEVRHDLDARDDGGAIADGDDGGLLEQAVDAKAHHHAFGARLEMNVAGAAGEAWSRIESTISGTLRRSLASAVSRVSGF